LDFQVRKKNRNGEKKNPYEKFSKKIFFREEDDFIIWHRFRPTCIFWPELEFPQLFGLTISLLQTA